ncbi:MAG TPA: DUF1080 domain-containing protein [Planctomycetaceae bacterium]|nr:DUF1080 domain-containing protein [Planctomycetaceae bacterium]|tara:strand:+ start:4288 stop:4941 length:654 start_codon:yes stop_codon:yes gene_type:complete
MLLVHSSLLSFALLTIAPAPDTVTTNQGFTRLFDGKTLSGWEGDQKLFRVVDGVIVAGSLKQPIPRNEFLCTRKTYENFELRLQARLRGKGNNAGIQFRSRRIPNNHEVIGYQCDMGSTSEFKNIWGWLYDESRRRTFLARPAGNKAAHLFKPNDWNELRIRCQGQRIQIWLNGVQTIDYSEPDKRINRRGVIGLQIHGGAASEASYKDIRIKELSP